MSFSYQNTGKTMREIMVMYRGIFDMMEDTMGDFDDPEIMGMFMLKSLIPDPMRRKKPLVHRFRPFVRAIKV